MELQLGEFLTRWTIRGAVGCYLFRVAVELYDGGHRSTGPWLRIVWTAGFLLYGGHVLAAFHWFHSWSHAAAVEHAARQTADVAGIPWGGGVYVNYLFTAYWLGDVIVWWLTSDALRKSRRYQLGTHAVFGFMMFNATVVFGPPFWRWIAALAAGVFLVARWQRRHSRETTTTSDQTRK